MADPLTLMSASVSSHRRCASAASRPSLLLLATLQLAQYSPFEPAAAGCAVRYVCVAAHSAGDLSAIALPRCVKIH